VSRIDGQQHGRSVWSWHSPWETCVPIANGPLQMVPVTSTVSTKFSGLQKVGFGPVIF